MRQTQKEKRAKAKINTIRNEKEVMTDTTDIRRIIRDYYEQLYANKMDNIEEMDKFLERHNLPRLQQKEIENKNGPITSTEIESVILKLPTKVQNQMASQANFNKHLEKS